jgi:TnsA endonuclease N terminal
MSTSVLWVVRRIPLSRRSHITGFQPQALGITEHESALERDFVTLARFADAAAQITAQPVTIEFQDQGRTRRYTPDFLVQWSAGEAELVEVKYQADLRRLGKQLRPRFIAARRWAREHSARFRVATERSIRTPRLRNAQRLLPLRDAWLDPEDARQVRTALVPHAQPTLGELLQRLPGERGAVLGILWRMMARGALSVDLDVPITLGSPIGLPRRVAPI